MMIKQSPIATTSTAMFRTSSKLWQNTWHTMSVHNGQTLYALTWCMVLHIYSDGGKCLDIQLPSALLQRKMTAWMLHLLPGIDLLQHNQFNPAHRRLIGHRFCDTETKAL